MILLTICLLVAAAVVAGMWVAHRAPLTPVDDACAATDQGLDAGTHQAAA